MASPTVGAGSAALADLGIFARGSRRSHITNQCWKWAVNCGGAAYPSFWTIVAVADPLYSHLYHPLNSSSHPFDESEPPITMPLSPEEAVTFKVEGSIAIITLNIPKKLNAMTQDLYFRTATLLQEIAKMDNVLITILTGNGRFFSA
jgi:hypothetical protein